jgi:hypothetical protein
MLVPGLPLAQELFVFEMRVGSIVQAMVSKQQMSPVRALRILLVSLTTHELPWKT